LPPPWTAEHSDRTGRASVKIIHKTPSDWAVPRHLKDYEQTRAMFDWSKVPPLCPGMAGGGCNIAYAAVDRHARRPVGYAHSAEVRQ
jgi:hypothetical protein